MASRWAGPFAGASFSGQSVASAHAAIQLDDGVEILFALTGLSSLEDGQGVHVMTFQTAERAYGWVNDVLAVGEGTVDVEHARLAMRYYECGVELPLEGFSS